VSTNVAENHFSQLKRSIDGTFHHVSREHLERYLTESHLAPRPRPRGRAEGAAEGRSRGAPAPRNENEPVVELDDTEPSQSDPLSDDASAADGRIGERE
jgi:hypothetical protein